MKKELNTKLNTAKTNKNDEFYTQYHDIEKKLIATYYNESGDSYRTEIARGEDNVLLTASTPLKQNGDFRSVECIEILKESDIVVTNPPFSLFREYVAQLIEHDKKYLIIGNMNAITYKDIFKLIKENKLWLGHSIHSGDREFRVPDHYPLESAGFRIDEDGNKYIRVKGVRWFTNLDYKERHENLILHKQYNEEEYPKYDNFNAININKTKDIPSDYSGVMGVPISFLDKYNPEQFEIIGCDYDVKCGLLPNIINPSWRGKLDRGYIGGKRIYARILIKKKGC